jgi:hypothetical protein
MTSFSRFHNKEQETRAAMIEYFRHGVLRLTADADKITIFREMSAAQQLETIVLGAIAGVAGLASYAATAKDIESDLAQNRGVAGAMKNWLRAGLAVLAELHADDDNDPKRKADMLRWAQDCIPFSAEAHDAAVEWLKSVGRWSSGSERSER